MLQFPCPCCGYIVFTQPPGAHGVCPICNWEDDLSQLRFPLMPGLSNHSSLQSAQKNYATSGASAKHNPGPVRKPEITDQQDEGWRQLDTEHDNIEEPHRGIDYNSSYPQDTTVLYYWRETYWRAGHAC